jgi:hypothetical protein
MAAAAGIAKPFGPDVRGGIAPIQVSVLKVIRVIEHLCGARSGERFGV